MRLPNLCIALPVAIACVANPVFADTVIKTGGEKLVGKVSRFNRNHDTAAGSSFVIEIDGKEQVILLREIDEIVFEGRSLAGSTEKPQNPRPARSSGGDEEEKHGKYWISSSGKRHNSSCRYYGSGKGHACGPKDGVPCKLCGG